MSIRRVIKLMERIRDFKGLEDSDLRKFTSDYGQEIQNRLIDGLTGSYNIEGKAFKSLEPKTIANRRSMGIAGTKPLIAERNLLNFVRNKDQLMQTGKVQIKLNDPSEDYMTFQNEGFDNVPARKWYGIPKTHREGGTKYNEFLKKIISQYEKNFKAILR